MEKTTYAEAAGLPVHVLVTEGHDPENHIMDEVITEEDA